MLYILGEVRPDTPEAMLVVIVGVSWIDDGHSRRQGAFYKPTVVLRFYGSTVVLMFLIFNEMTPRTQRL